jgi:hypothetical protein
MKVDFLEGGAPECPLIRIYGTELRAFVELREITRFLGNTPSRSVSLRDQPSYLLESMSELKLGNEGNSGVEVRNGIGYWQLSRANWHVVSGLIDGLVELSPKRFAYNWLAGPEAQEPINVGDISVLISWSERGEW